MVNKKFEVAIQGPGKFRIVCVETKDRGVKMIERIEKGDQDYEAIIDIPKGTVIKVEIHTP